MWWPGGGGGEGLSVLQPTNDSDGADLEQSGDSASNSCHLLIVWFKVNYLMFLHIGFLMYGMS
jgi:hypothetical protein